MCFYNYPIIKEEKSVENTEGDIIVNNSPNSTVIINNLKQFFNFYK